MPPNLDGLLTGTQVAEVDSRQAARGRHFLREPNRGVNVNPHTSQGPSPEEWRANLVKDGGRRVMYGGNAYEDDLEPAADAGEPRTERPAPVGGE
jgi:hypothetical protein